MNWTDCKVRMDRRKTKKRMDGRMLQEKGKSMNLEKGSGGESEDESEKICR